MVRKIPALCLLLLILLAACSHKASPIPPTPTATATQTASPLPTDTRAPTSTATRQPPTATPPKTTLTPTPAVMAGMISPQTADGLKTVHSFSAQEPAIRWLWSKDAMLVVETVKNYNRYDLAAMQLVESKDQTFAEQVVATSPDASKAVAIQKDGSLQIWDLATRQVTQTLRPTELPMGAVFSPDGLTLAVTSADTISVTLWDISSGKQIETLKGFETAAPTYRVQFSPDGHTLVWIARATVQFMDLQSQQMGARLSFEDFANSVVFAPDGKTAAIAVADFISMVQVSDGKEIQRINLEKAAVSLAYSPDGRLLANASGNDIEIRNASSGKTIATLKGHPSMVRLVGFAPDGRSLLSGADDGTIFVWRVLP
jgi:WD40 repeat protein